MTSGDPRTSRIAGRWLAAPRSALLLLIVLGTALRLVFASAMGLGIDESYTVATARHLALSYYDHPPLSWWLTWGTVQLFGSEDAIVVRLPFIALFALSTWLMYLLGEALFSARTGLWAAIAFNCAPVFGVTSASWVLPDGPLICAMLAATLCLVRAMSSEQWRWWIGVGICTGLALLSKYSAVLGIAGAGLYLLTQPGDRRWLLRAEPYAAALIALALFSPVLIWNAQHDWVSFAFQGGRAAGVQIRPTAPFVTLAGGALYLLPWIWLPILLLLIKAAKSGPARSAEWLLCCIGAVPIVFFSLISLWARGRVAFHWAAPGYLVLFPLLGHAIAERLQHGDRRVRAWFAGTAILVVVIFLAVAAEIRWSWLPDSFASAKNPALAAVDWTSVRTQLAERGLLDAETPAVATLRWHDAGKLDYALRGSVPVICLGNDPRQYGIAEDASRFRGHDLLIVAPRMTLAEIESRVGSMFAKIETLPPLTLVHGGRVAMSIPLFRGENLLRPPN